MNVFDLISPRLCRGVLFCSLCMAFFLPTSALAQRASPYRLSYQLDVPLLIGSGGLIASSLLRDRQIRPLSPAQLQLQTPDDISAFDRAALGQWRPRTARLSDVLLIGSAALPYGVMLLPGGRQHWKETFVMANETLFLTFGLTNLSKVLALRPRPYSYLNDPNFADLLSEKDARYSFFSGHTSISAAACWYTAAVFEDLYPTSNARPYVWAGAILLPATVAYLRVRTSKHFPTDVITGYAVGALVGYLVPRLHHRKAKRAAPSQRSPF